MENLNLKSIICKPSFFVEIDCVGNLDIILPYVVGVILISIQSAQLNTDVKKFFDKFEKTEQELSWYLQVHIFTKTGKWQLLSF